MGADRAKDEMALSMLRLRCAGNTVNRIATLLGEPRSKVISGTDQVRKEDEEHEGRCLEEHYWPRG